MPSRWATNTLFISLSIAVLLATAWLYLAYTISVE